MKNIAFWSKDATFGAPGLTRNKKLRSEQRASLRTERSDARGGWRPSRGEEKPSEGEVVAVGPGSVKDKPRESRRSKEQRKMNTKRHDEQNRKKKELRTERRKVKVENPSRFLASACGNCGL